MAAGEHDVEEHAQGVDVGAGRDLALGDLFRGRVGRGQQRIAGASELGDRGLAVVGLQQPRDPEIQQLHLAAGGDHDVGRLEVAMHDEVGVRVRHRCQHVEEELEAGVETHPPTVAVRIDGLAVHELEHQVRLANRRDAGVAQLRDLRVREPGEDAPLAGEAIFARAPHQGGVEQLDGHPAFEAPVSALRHPHGAHPPVADRCDQPVGAQLQTGQRRARRLERGGVCQEVGVIDVGAFREPVLDLRGQVGRVRANRRQPCGALVGRQIERRVQVRAGGLPAGAPVARHSPATRAARRREGRRAGRHAPWSTGGVRCVPTCPSWPRSRRTRSRRST